MLPDNESLLQLPVIDIASPTARTAELLVNAAAEYGFFYIRSQGVNIDAKTVNEIFGLSQEFFDSTEDEKNACAIGEGNKGWLSMQTELLDPSTQKRGDYKEGFNLAEFADGKPQQPLPISLAPHEETLGRFADSCKTLCMNLLELIAQGLRIPKTKGGHSWFSSRHDSSLGPSGCTLRLLFYPRPLPSNRYDDETDMRCGAHSDYGSLTLLFQKPSQQGLEIRTSKGTWHAVEVSPASTRRDPYPPILVNIGDLFQYWTRGMFKSVVHRVIFPRDSREDRYSIAYFCHPADESPLLPVPSSIIEAHIEEGVAKDEDHTQSIMTAGEYLQSRLQATYKFA